jgi:hypothetical protein
MAMFAGCAIGGPANAQQPVDTKSCNPVIDGTYCATQGGRAFNGSSSSSSANLQPIQSLSGDLSLGGGDNTATFAGISFSGSTTCAGFLRRSSCN